MIAPAAGEPARSATRPALVECAARSYLADGTGIGWRVDVPAGWRVAVDAERADQRLPPHVRRRSGLDPQVSGERAVAAWTRAEVLAKLTDTPILLRLREFGLDIGDLGEHAPVAVQTHRHDRIVVTVGARFGEPTPLR